MKKPFLFPVFMLCLTLFITGACQPAVTPAGALTNVNFAYEDFSEIEITRGFTVTITRGDVFSINVTFDKALQEYFIIEQHGKILTLGLDGGPEYANAVRRAIITLPDLRRLEISGMTSAAVSGFNDRQAIELELSGGSTVKLENMVTGASTFKLTGQSEVEGMITMSSGDLGLSGSSSMELQGSAKTIKLNGSGQSRFDMADFTVDTATVKLSGSSQASLSIASMLDLNLRDASHLEYYGDPLLRQYEITGGSTVNHRQTSS